MTSTLRVSATAALTALCLSLSHIANASPTSTDSISSPSTKFQFLPTSQTGSHSLVDSDSQMRQAYQLRVSDFLTSRIKLNSYHTVGVQTIQDSSGHNDHLIVLMHRFDSHRVDIARVPLNSNDEPTGFESNYSLTREDFAAQPLAVATCPDPSVQFIAFAPNNYALEIQITQDVAKQARAAGLRTVEFYKQDATRANYLAYMSCPNLKGNFYDGDANPGLITTADGTIQASDLAQLNFNYKVTNIWLACQAFNDPMLSTMLSTAKSQKYAAGQNDLKVGPSDRTAACAMNAALKGRPMTASFQQCYQALDITADHWGFDGAGSDIFGQ